MADTKTLLKEARKHIDNQNFKEAQECCKNILRNDKQNYLALVLLGKSFEDSDQAPLAYQKAISCKPDHSLAWQGLANYYERKEDSDSKRKLLAIYNDILKLDLDDEKSLEVISKLGQLGCLLKESTSFEIILCFYKNNLTNIKITKAAEKQLLDLLKSKILFKEECIPDLLFFLDKVYKEEPNDGLEILIGRVILQKSKFAESVLDVLNLPFFADNVVLREIVCQHCCKKYIENESFCDLPIDIFIEKIVEGVENSKYPELLRSIILYDKGLYLEAYKQCVPLINYHQAEVTEATFIIKCIIKLKKWTVAQKLVTNFLSKAKDATFFRKLHIFLFISLYHQQKWSEAINITKQIPMDCLSEQELANLAECYIAVDKCADEIINQLKSTEYYTKLQAKLLLKNGKYQETIELIQSSSNEEKYLFYLSRAYWELKQYDKCYVTLLRSAKTNSDHAETFFYLGVYYEQFKNDLQKAKKCYEKAFNLNDNNVSIIKNLSDIYIKLELTELDYDLLINVEKNIQSSESWIQFRLGLHNLNKRDWENAILKFRNVIKSDKNNIVALECLADAYFSRGSFTSALRAYNKVMQVNPAKSAHCLTRIGHIYTLLTNYQDAISTFEKVFEIDPYSILSLKGISETWIKIAKKRMEAKLYGSARDCAQHAIDYISKALANQKQYLCFWKLLGDTLIFITKLPTKYAYVYIQKSFESSDIEIVKKDRRQIFPHAIACYSLITRRNQLLSSYDLVSAYLAYYNETLNVVNCKIAFNLALACIKEKPYLWQNWNLLGKICIYMNKYHWAQHCFIKALLVTRKWSVAKIWCNLGTLYVKLKLHKLANYCFWRGQSTMPSYPHSWIGQGLIAEVIREEEAMDLFRHASRLGYHPESALGYADWVCRILNSNAENAEFKYVIKGLHAITYAMDLVEWYISFQPEDACALTILGILQERNGLLHAAYNSYEKALKYVEDDKKNISLLNLGRILFRLEKFDEAIKTYKEITEASFNSTNGLALALFKNGLFEEAYSVYDTALHWLTNDDMEKADLLVAMGGIVYMFKGIDDAKTLLFHSIQISPNKPTAHSLFAICSLGFIHADQNLSKLALEELKKYNKDSRYEFDIGFFKSYPYVCEDDIEEAIKILSDSLHDHPSNVDLWFCMAQYCLKIENGGRARVASNCAQRALSTTYNEFSNMSAKMIALASIAEYISGDQNNSLRLAKDGLHRFPNQPEIWAALVFSLLSNTYCEDKKYWIKGAADHMKRHFNISKPLSRWVNSIKKKCSS